MFSLPKEDTSGDFDLVCVFEALSLFQTVSGLPCDDRRVSIKILVQASCLFKTVCKLVDSKWKSLLEDSGNSHRIHNTYHIFTPCHPAHLLSSAAFFVDLKGSTCALTSHVH